MPLTSVRIRLDRDEENADAVYWEWAVDGATHDDTDGVALVNSTLTGLENAVGATGANWLINMDADLIELFPGDGGEAYYVQGLAPGVPIGTGTNGSHVLQCAVNELVSTPRGVSPRGRMFVGPIAQFSPTLSTTAVANAVSIMQEVASQHIADGYTPVVISRINEGAERPSAVGMEVVGFRADQRVDILKSRRVDSPDTDQDFPLEPAA